MTHDFGACFHASESAAIGTGVPPFMSNSIILQTFGYEGFHPCQLPKNSIIIPPYVSVKANHQLVVNVNRTIWAYFRGKMEIHPRRTKEGAIYSKLVNVSLLGSELKLLIHKLQFQIFQNQKIHGFLMPGECGLRYCKSLVMIRDSSFSERGWAITKWRCFSQNSASVL